jgi:acetyl-CoA carboxylase/biotin carboxylase 1
MLLELDEALAARVGAAPRAELQAEITARERVLLPLYTQVTHEFADLHDRAGRMYAKGCVRDVLDWRSSRLFFYWRIRRRRVEDAIKDRLVAASGGVLTLDDAATKVSVYNIVISIVTSLPLFAFVIIMNTKQI